MLTLPLYSCLIIFNRFVPFKNSTEFYKNTDNGSMFLGSGNLYIYNSVVCGLRALFFHHQNPIANHLLKTTATTRGLYPSITSENFQFFEMVGRDFYFPVAAVVLLQVFQETGCFTFWCRKSFLMNQDTIFETKKQKRSKKSQKKKIKINKIGHCNFLNKFNNFKTSF